MPVQVDDEKVLNVRQGTNGRVKVDEEVMSQSE